ncbi:major capsid protein [Sodalis sp. RH20]|uniref:major capsid protein n=1 Tax=unclassified Sodalis (in: enterobacteria) TaxID=2636512 RepID=UPI0039B3B637
MNALEKFNLASMLPLFEAMPLRNYLLESLNIFDKTPSETIKVSVDQIINDNTSLLNKSNARYSSEFNTTTRPKAGNYLIEIPHFVRVDQAGVQDFQSKRKPGTELEETLMDIVTEYLQLHQTAYYRTQEASFAQSLFSGTVSVPYTIDRPLINWATEFGQVRPTANIDLSNQTIDVNEIFNGYVDTVGATLGGFTSNLRRYVVFAGAGFYNSLRFHASMKSAFQYVSPSSDDNVIFQRREYLPGITTFTMPGLSVDVIKVTDPLYTAFIGTNEAYMIPVFTEGTNIYNKVYGPASRHVQIAQGPTAEVYSYTIVDPKWAGVDVVNEFGILPVNHGIGMSLKITNTAA